MVKLGGSLATGPQLVPLLDELRRASDRGLRIVVVPGGGPFADAVRDAQARLGYDDQVAHDLALLAMAQFGRVLAALAGLPAHAGLPALRAQPGTAVWLPDPGQDAHALPASWQVTSDSLALWLAGELGATCVVLVKACAAPPQDDIAALAAAGIVDPYYAELSARLPGVATRVVFDASPHALRAALAATN